MHSGQCSCGAVTFRLRRDPMIVHACHCRDCQRHSGGAFVINAWIEAGEVEHLSGDLSHIDVSGGSGAVHRIHFCPNCGTHVWSEYLASPGQTRFVRVGTLEDPQALPPDIHIFTRSKAPWVSLPQDATVFEDYYDMREVWPPESLKRFVANMKETAR